MVLNYLTISLFKIPSWNGVFFEKLTVAELMKNFRSYTKPKSLLPCSQELANEFYPGKNEYYIPVILHNRMTITCQTRIHSYTILHQIYLIY
jgi:hypothetical protein